MPNAQIEYLYLDLASLESIKKAADEFISKESQLHILLNNAGVIAVAPEPTKDGFDIQWRPIVWAMLSIPSYFFQR